MKHIRWEDIPYDHVNEHFRRKLAWHGKLMIALTEVDKGFVVPRHSHENEQTTWVFRGKWRFQLDGNIINVGPGEMIFIPGNVVHTAEAVEAVVAYDIFTPPREDWLTGEDAYLRGDDTR